MLMCFFVVVVCIFLHLAPRNYNIYPSNSLAVCIKITHDPPPCTLFCFSLNKEVYLIS